ncbi:MAG: diacylglycerol kinase [Sphingomonadales bacterium]|nr:diacylglycerol kinase [Sphingomonadales bacterium]MDE2569940.1 diacylglycerol kinase [Sphingomonadales bacterium]
MNAAPAEPVWLVRNPASGSNDGQRLAAMRAALAGAGLFIACETAFPREALPIAADLDAAGIATLVVFAGDGTVNAAVTSLYGWGGQVLVLPGGTMNLVSTLLHGEADAPTIAGRLAQAKRRRLPVIRTARGDALAGVIVGPGTAWNHVREALRAGDVLGLVHEAATAIEESTAGAMVTCDLAAGACAHGYSAILVTPHEEGMAVAGYYAETFADYARQGAALLRRNFREGPHHDLGIVKRLRCTCTRSGQTGLLIDGEPAAGGGAPEFTLARCEVDLLATKP